jgi:hypothetical protein
MPEIVNEGIVEIEVDVVFPQTGLLFPLIG